MRTAHVRRVTRETEIELDVNLDGVGKYNLDTGIGFMDHMLSHVAVHGLLDLNIKATGDLDVDAHHTVEDVALCLGTAINEALGSREGIVRMGFAYVPMDETLGFVAVDFSGRPYAVVDIAWTGTVVGGIAVTLVEHFFESLAIASRANVHVRILYGRDDHHKAEALFKALGRALDNAVRIDPRREHMIPSTKGVI